MLYYRIKIFNKKDLLILLMKFLNNVYFLNYFIISNTI
jgi:hypothetical protein